MATFIVVAKTNYEAIAAAIKGLEGHASYPFKDDTWFVQYDGTSQELAEKLGIVSGQTGLGVVIPVSNYSGRAAADLWEWLKVRLSKAS